MERIVVTWTLYGVAFGVWFANSSYRRATARDAALQAAVEWIRTQHQEIPSRVAEWWSRCQETLAHRVRQAPVWEETAELRHEMVRRVTENPWTTAGLVVLATGTGIEKVTVNLLYVLWVAPLFWVVDTAWGLAGMLLVRCVGRMHEILAAAATPTGGWMALLVCAMRVQQQPQRRDEHRTDGEEGEEAPLIDGRCCVCLDRPATHAFLPCGHKCCCRIDAQRILSRDGAKCPICTQVVTSTAHIYD